MPEPINAIDAWFLSHPEVTQAEFAQRAGLTEAQVSRFRREPDLSRLYVLSARKIVAATDGEITMDDFAPGAASATP